MATWNVILLVDRPGEEVRGGALDRAAAAAFELMEDLEARLSKFIPESDVALMNALAAARPVAVPRLLLELLEDSRRAWEVTRGAFDPTVGPLVRAWGFDSGEGRVPSAGEIAELLSRRGMDHVIIDSARGTVRFDRPGVTVDLGGIAKGAIVDRAVALLRERGVASGAVISGRSTIVTWGSPPGGGRWRVGVASPAAPEEALVELEVEPGAISTSAGYERKVEAGGAEHGHVLDPRTGRPARRALAVTVWTPSAVPGDVASTALFVLGREEGQTILEDLAPVSAVFIEEDSGRWGGMRWDVSHAPAGGEPGFRVARG